MGAGEGGHVAFDVLVDPFLSDAQDLRRLVKHGGVGRPKVHGRAAFVVFLVRRPRQRPTDGYFETAADVDQRGGGRAQIRAHTVGDPLVEGLDAVPTIDEVGGLARGSKPGDERAVGAAFEGGSNRWV